MARITIVFQETQAPRFDVFVEGITKERKAEIGAMSEEQKRELLSPAEFWAISMFSIVIHAMSCAGGHGYPPLFGEQALTTPESKGSSSESDKNPSGGVHRGSGRQYLRIVLVLRPRGSCFWIDESPGEVDTRRGLRARGAIKAPTLYATEIRSS